MEFIDLHVEDPSLASPAGDIGWARVVSPIPISSPTLCQEAKKRARESIILVSGDPSILRNASECWEVDLVSPLEDHSSPDFMHYKNSGLDYQIARNCAERGIALELNISKILYSHGRKRAQIMARMSQNIQICRDTGCDIVITSGASDLYTLRSPRDLLAIGVLLGMAPAEAKAALTSVPARILKRLHDRNDPAVILKGLRVLRGPHLKRKYHGWY